MATGNTIDKLVVEIRAETAQLRRDLKKIDNQLKATTNTSKGLNMSLKSVGTALVAFGAVGAIRSIIQTTRTFEDLKATLEAITGSAKTAALSFDVIKDFTATTTFQLDGVTKAFITFLQAGITPTTDALRDFGNLAAAFDKDISVLAQAVFRAMTGEMEMLKQFNVIMRVEGDKFNATFDGVTTKVDRNGEAIAEYIRSIARARFPDALEKRADTLSGAISNLDDAFAIFQFTIGEVFRPILIQTARDLAQFFNENENGAEIIGNVLAGAFKTLAGIVKVVTNNMDLLMGLVVGLTTAAVLNGLVQVVNLVIALGKAIRAAGVAQAILNALSTRGIALLTMGATIGTATMLVNRAFGDDQEELGKFKDEVKDTEANVLALEQALMKTLNAQQLFSKEQNSMISLLTDAGKVTQTFADRLNNAFGMDTTKRIQSFNTQLEDMRKIFNDRKILEVLAGKGAGFTDFDPATAPGNQMFRDVLAGVINSPFGKGKTLEEVLDFLNQQQSNLGFSDFSFVRIATEMVPDPEKEGETIKKLVARGIKHGQVEDVIGDDVFAQFLGFKDYADLQHFANNFLPVGNIQNAFKLFSEAISDPMNLDLMQGMGLDLDPFKELRFITQPENIENLRAFIQHYQDLGKIPPGFGESAEDLELITQALTKFLDVSDRELLELSDVASMLEQFARETKFPTPEIEDFTQAIKESSPELKKYFDEISAKYPTLFDDYDDFITTLQDGVEELEGAVKTASELFGEELLQAVVSSTNAFTTQFVDALLRGESALESFKNFSRQLVSQIIATFLQLAVVNQILNAAFGLTGTADALPTFSGRSSSSGSGLSTTPVGNPRGGYASGGRLQMGMPTLVGERGAELFIPDSSGRLMNSMNTKDMMGGGSPIIVNQSINFATGVVPTVRAEVTKMMPDIAEVTKGAVAEAAMRGGSYRRMLQGG